MIITSFLVSFLIIMIGLLILMINYLVRIPTIGAPFENRDKIDP